MFPLFCPTRCAAREPAPAGHTDTLKLVRRFQHKARENGTSTFESRIQLTRRDFSQLPFCLAVLALQLILEAVHASAGIAFMVTPQHEHRGWARQFQCGDGKIQLDTPASTVHIVSCNRIAYYQVLSSASGLPMLPCRVAREAQCHGELGHSEWPNSHH